jgi:hypothetical protein
MGRVSAEQVSALCDVWWARRAAGLSLAQVRELLGDPARPVSDWPPAVIRALAGAIASGAKTPGAVRAWRPPFTRPKP